MNESPPLVSCPVECGAQSGFLDDFKHLELTQVQTATVLTKGLKSISWKWAATLLPIISVHKQKHIYILFKPTLLVIDQKLHQIFSTLSPESMLLSLMLGSEQIVLIWWLNPGWTSSFFISSISLTSLPLNSPANNQYSLFIFDLQTSDIQTNDISTFQQTLEDSTVSSLCFTILLKGDTGALAVAQHSTNRESVTFFIASND